ncbi:transketolase-like protein 2 [Cricetulus griseus]|uniref:transketolase n=1 Tax=Cricetulus griseus TaxID=10029 RepID=A0A061HZ48_CRIGR|nr:transketolase-like protein 2 [Cricetulus griseus]
MAYTGKYLDQASLLLVMSSAASEMPGLNLGLLKRWEAFGWTYVVDGHDLKTLCHVFSQAAQVRGKPRAVVVKIFKARGMPNVEDAESWYGRPMPKERADEIIKLIESQIQTNRILVPPPPIEDLSQINIMDINMTSPPVYIADDMVSTQKTCSLSLTKLGHENDRVIVLDGDTKNSNFSDIFKKEPPERFIQCYIAEQNMVNVALSCATRDGTIAFEYDAGNYANENFILVSVTYQGLLETGKSEIGLKKGGNQKEGGKPKPCSEQFPTAFYPSNAISKKYAVYLAANTEEMCFIRTRQAETFQIGQAKVVCHSENDKVTIIGAGLTLQEALLAADELSKEAVSIHVIDLFTIKLLDTVTIISNAKATSGRIITVEEHYPEGVFDALGKWLEENFKVLRHFCFK